MQLNVLGNVRLYFNNQQVPLGSGREREILVLLALANDRPLSVEELAHRLWDTPPPTYRSTLHTYITRLRRRLESAGIDRSLLSYGPDGYQLELAPETIDWRQMENARVRAHALRQADRHPYARALLREALRLRKGTPLSGLSGQWMTRMRVTMERAHQEILVDWATLSLDSGDISEVLPVLDKAVVLYPVNESLHRCVLRALRSLGRTADALVVYQQIRERLTEELGVSPSASLQREFEEVLQATGASTDLRRPGQACATDAAPPSVDNLDRDQKLFRGRHSELLLLTSRLREQASPSPHVWIVSGMAGVGKSSLVMRVAHQVKDNFPHARLTVDLRGHHGQLAPLTPGEAITELLRLLHIPARHIPESFSDQVALWREHTRSMRMLLILDDAASAEQIDPLLPVGAGSAVLVTSRFQLPEVDEADHLPLGLPSVGECIEMFTTASGRSVQQAEGDLTLETVVTRCGRLPLALRLMATLLRLRPSWTLRSLLERLSVGQGSLDAFRVGQIDLTRVFDLALRSVSPEARQAFLRLGLHPTRIVSGPIAAALISSDEATARDTLVELVGACLIEEHKPDRFRAHTLVKEHASSTAQRELSSSAINASRERMYESYLTRCVEADGVLHPHRPGRGPQDSIPRDTDWDRERAESWFRGELPNLLVVIHSAYSQGHGSAAGDLGHSIAEYLDLHGPWHTASAIHEQALSWLQGQPDSAKKARTHFNLGRALLRTGDVQGSFHHIHTAQEQWTHSSDRLGAAWGIAFLGLIDYVAGRYDQSLQKLEHSRDIFETTKSISGIVFTLRNRGLCHFSVSSFHEAIGDLSDVLRVLERSPDPQILSDVQLNLAGALQQLGFHREAWDLCETVLKSAQEKSDDRRCAFAWINLGELSLHRQRPEMAIECLSKALACLDRFSDPWSKPTALCNMGTAYALLNQQEDAQRFFQSSLELRGFSQPTTIFDALIGLAQIEQDYDNQGAEIDYFEQAIAVASQYGLRKEQAQALHTLGQRLVALGLGRAGKNRLTEAAALYEELDSPEAPVVQSLLDAFE